MKKIIFLLLFALFAIQSIAQSNCDIINEYSTIFSVERRFYKERIYFSSSIRTLDSSDCFAELINNNSLYFSYLLKHTSDFHLNDSLILTMDSTELNRKFIHILQNDSLFTHAINDVVDRSNIHSSFKPDTVRMDELLTIASKFFYVFEWSGNTMRSAICGTNNALRITSEERHAHLEAFCFTSIFGVSSEEYNKISKEFDKAIAEAINIELGIDETERLLRLQGAVFIQMKNNEVLKDHLRSEYNKHIDFLPFILIE